MTVTTFNLATLKRVKNSVIGNPTAKLALARDDMFIQMLVDCINNPLPYLESSQGSGDDIRIEAAHIIASISYGSSAALGSLLNVNAHQAFLYAISVFQPTDPPALKAAFARALRAFTVAIADAVGPEQWGLRDRPSEVRDEASVALDYLFEVETLDVYLPLLDDSSFQTACSIAQLLGAALRSQPYRQAVSDWIPPAERNKEVKGKRGWERAEPTYQGGWVAKQLVALLQKKDVKLQEAALAALASLSKDNRTIALKLINSSPDHPAALPYVLFLCKSRNTDLQLAACLCAANITRAGDSSTYHSHYPSDVPESTAAMTVIHIINSVLTSPTETAQIRAKACFTLYHLVADDKELCQLAYDRGSLTRLAQLVTSITPTEAPNTWDEDEPESISSLREAAFTAIAAIALFENDIRCEITDNLRLIPHIQISLSHRHVGVRYAACQCVRALSRAVAVLRTNIMDTGLGMSVFEMFGKGLAEGEDKRVMFAVSAVICNLVNDFSPLRSVLLSQGVIPKLVRLLGSEDPGLKLNALWAFKNLLYKSNLDVKRQVIDGVGWGELSSLLALDSDPGIQEQAFHVVRHIADGDEGTEMVFEGMGDNELLDTLSVALEAEDENVVRQAVCLLGNLANSDLHKRSILSHTPILCSLRSCLVDAKVEVRRPAASCILELVRDNRNLRSLKELHDAGIDSTLRHICENYGGHGSGGGSIGGGSPIARVGSGFQMGMEDDGEVRDKAKEALQWLEQATDTGMF